MLRALVLLLLIANAGFWSWRQGWLEPLHGFIGAGPEGDREPQRLARQVAPETVRVLDAASAPAASPSPPPPADAAASAAQAAVCLEAGPFTPAELAVAQATLQGALPGGWVLRDLAPGRPWWIAMGPYTDTELLQRRKDELRRRDIEPEQATLSAGAAPWLVLARHDSREAAEAGLAGYAARGVRNARTVEGTPVELRALRVAQADAAQQALLAALPADPLHGRAFLPCPLP
jgi:hypothetical protein